MKTKIPQKDMAFADEPFALVAERGIDFERAAQEAEARRKAAEEAKRITDSTQLSFA